MDDLAPNPMAKRRFYGRTSENHLLLHLACTSVFSSQHVRCNKADIRANRDVSRVFVSPWGIFLSAYGIQMQCSEARHLANTDRCSIHDRGNRLSNLAGYPFHTCSVI